MCIVDIVQQLFILSLFFSLNFSLVINMVSETVARLGHEQLDFKWQKWTENISNEHMANKGTKIFLSKIKVNY